VHVCEKEVRTRFYVRLLRVLLHEINGITILFFLPEDGLIGTETCWIIEAYFVYFDGRFFWRDFEISLKHSNSVWCVCLVISNLLRSYLQNYRKMKKVLTFCWHSLFTVAILLFVTFEFKGNETWRSRLFRVP